MRDGVGTLLLGALVLFASIEALAQCDPPSNVVLTMLGRVTRPSGDRATVTADESVPGVNEGQGWYVPAYDAPGRQRLNRLYAVDDNMDSLLTDEGGYQLNWFLGSPFVAAQPFGTCGIRRWYNPSTHDHLTAGCTEDPSFAGYQPEGLLGYGFPRYGGAGEVPVVVQGSAVGLVANLAAGGAVSELWWSGKQFVNAFDYGRYIQMAVFLRPDGRDNPTEAGDGFGWPGQTLPVCVPAPTNQCAKEKFQHGSPLALWSVEGTTLRTTTLPLQFNPGDFGGGSANPVLWSGRMGKEVTLDFAGRPNVIRWLSRFTLPAAVPYFDVEVLTAYLTAEFVRVYDYEPETDQLLSRALPVNSCSVTAASAGGLILATADDAYALGLYRRGQEHSPNWRGVCSLLGAGNSGKYEADTVKSNLRQTDVDGLPAGQYDYLTYVVVGTTSTVRLEMRDLYAAGY